MTVKELIEKLKEFDESKEVYIFKEGFRTVTELELCNYPNLEEFVLVCLE